MVEERGVEGVGVVVGFEVVDGRGGGGGSIALNFRT